MEKYRKILDSIASDLSLLIVTMTPISNDLVEVTLRNKENPKVAVDLEACSNAARLFAEAIDYEVGLDVSSEGAEHEIRVDDYASYIGAYVHVKFKQPKEGIDKVEGEFVSVDENSLVIRYRFKHTHKEINIERDNIELLRTAVKL